MQGGIDTANRRDVRHIAEVCGAQFPHCVTAGPRHRFQQRAHQCRHRRDSTRFLGRCMLQPVVLDLWAEAHPDAVTVRPHSALHRPLHEPGVGRPDRKREIPPLGLPGREGHQLVDRRQRPRRDRSTGLGNARSWRTLGARRQALTAAAALHHAAIKGFGWMMPFIPLIDQNCPPALTTMVG